MADSANILSILASLGSQGQTPPPGADAPDVQLPGVAQNVMQAAAPPPSPAPVLPDTANKIADAATAASPPVPKPRRSLLDTIGRISDVLATVGGAQALYQPTLDARENRANALADRQRQIEKEGVDLATSKFDLSNKQGTDERSRFANVLDAISDPEDAANMPAMMQAAGLTDPKYAPFIAMVQKDPDQAKVLSTALGGGDSGEMGKTIKFGYDSAGNRIAFTVDGDGNTHVLQGVTPDANFKIVNQGDRQTALGPNGKPTIVLPVHESPNTVATTAQSNTNNIRTTTTAKEIAGMPARTNIKPAGAAGGGAAAANTLLDNIQRGFDQLHGLKALPGEGGALNQVESALGRTALGQKIGEQANSPAAQTRAAMLKDLKSLQAQMVAALPASATRTKFEQEIQSQRLPNPATMSYATANQVIKDLRQQFTQAQQAAAAEVARKGGGAAPARSNLPTYTPEQVRSLKLPSGTRFLGTDGQERFVH